ncbi:hypothetical protein HK102_009140 [Quaeritorhiza haematococci]|nr:hypothetical protein HK102_009140 [Quaeritorhiza haematococci]
MNAAAVGFTPSLKMEPPPVGVGVGASLPVHHGGGGDPWQQPVTALPTPEGIANNNNNATTTTSSNPLPPPTTFVTAPLTKSSVSKPPKPQKLYALKVAKIPGIFRTWAMAKTLIDGCPGARYKGFYSLDAAMSWIREDFPDSTFTKNANDDYIMDNPEPVLKTIEAAKQKKARQSGLILGVGVGGVEVGGGGGTTPSRDMRIGIGSGVSFGSPSAHSPGGPPTPHSFDRLLGDVLDTVEANGNNPSASSNPFDQSGNESSLSYHECLLSKVEKDPRFGLTLTDWQSKVLNHVKRGHNVFFQGPSGSGKSTLLIHIIAALAKLQKRVVITSITGTSASNIGGQTLHSWSGVGKSSLPSKQVVSKIRKNPTCKRAWMEADALIIDDASLLSAHLFDLLDYVGKNVRRNLKVPFGGIQLVFAGDFFGGSNHGFSFFICLVAIVSSFLFIIIVVVGRIIGTSSPSSAQSN